MNRTLFFHKTYMKVALELSNLSYAVRKKVGAIIVDNNNNIISYGYNGTPKGFDNNCEYIDSNGILTTKPEVLHAESNAITKLANSNNKISENTKMYITLSPCINCAKLIIQTGIKEVFYYEEYRDKSGIDFLKKSGVKINKIKL